MKIMEINEIRKRLRGIEELRSMACSLKTHFEPGRGRSRHGIQADVISHEFSGGRRRRRRRRSWQCPRRRRAPILRSRGYIWGYCSSSKRYLTYYQHITLECESLAATKLGHIRYLKGSIPQRKPPKISAQQSRFVSSVIIEAQPRRVYIWGYSRPLVEVFSKLRRFGNAMKLTDVWGLIVSELSRQEPIF
jgi:hypothetical protein